MCTTCEFVRTRCTMKVGKQNKSCTTYNSLQIELIHLKGGTK